jgi:hypothetical protein
MNRWIPKASQVSIAQVIGKDDDNIRAALGSLARPAVSQGCD